MFYIRVLDLNMLKTLISDTLAIKKALTLLVFELYQILWTFSAHVLTVDGKQLPPRRVFGRNSLPRAHIGTRIDGNVSYQPPGAP